MWLFKRKKNQPVQNQWTSNQAGPINFPQSGQVMPSPSAPLPPSTGPLGYADPVPPPPAPNLQTQPLTPDNNFSSFAPATAQPVAPAPNPVVPNMDLSQAVPPPPEAKKIDIQGPVAPTMTAETPMPAAASPFTSGPVQPPSFTPHPPVAPMAPPPNPADGQLPPPPAS